MHPTTLLLALFPLLPSTLARISGFALPRTIAPGASFPITIITENYIQSVADVAMAFGIASASAAENGTLGRMLESEVLVPGKWMRFLKI